MAKNFKRMLSAALATVLCVSSISLTAFADNDQANATGQSTNINKTATVLDDKDQTEVTLSVPGEAEVLGSDIIYIVGSYASNADGTPNVEGDVLISSLMDTIEEMVAMGTYVNFGMVPFSSDDVVAMPLTAITKENIDALPGMIANALATCEAVYDGVNMENALIKSKNMFSASELADHPERQHLVMISSGFTYFFNSGENNEYVSTVPVNYTGVNRLFYWNKAWQRARTNQTNTYPIPKGIVDAYNAKTDKSDNETLWDFYWSYIDQWSKADMAAGDKVVYEACTIESADFIKWYNSGELVSGYSQTGYGKAIPNTTEEDIANAVTLTAGADPLKKDANGEYTASAKAAAHAIGYERAMWEAYEYTKANITGAGINFYPIYNALNVNYNNGTWSPESYGVNWTNQYIGHSFVDMLAGGKAVMYDKQGDKTFFDPIKNEIIYYCSIDSTVEDYIGYDAEKGNFEFIADAATITLKKSGLEAPYTTAQIETKEGATASYAFTAPGADTPTFWLDYYYGDGKTTEKFIWTFGENVSKYVPVSLTYKLQLTEKSEEAGDHIIDTNLSATLYPMDSNGQEGTPEVFPVPNVTYTVIPYDVDIIIALGAGIAQYDADSTKGSNTYDSIIALVEPLVNAGINVKLGLVAVEHYDDVAMELTELTKDNYTTVITAGLDKIQNMPVGPTNLEGNILAAKAMLDADTSVPAANKFFHVIATGRTYCFDDAEGNPATIINKVALKGSTYYYWGHYLWQSQRGGHTSLYMIPARYNNDWDAYWADVTKWIEADGDTYVYSFPAYDTTNANWYKDYYAANTKDAKAMGLASSRFGWIFNDLTNSGLAAIGSGSNPQNALNYERGQYDAYQAYQAMKETGYNCYALCSESVNYQNGSPYIQVAKYTGTSTIQLGHSFMNFLAGGEATVLFELLDNNGNYKMLTNFFEEIDMDKLVKSTENTESKQPIFSTGPSVSVEDEAEEKADETLEETEDQIVELAILTQPQDAEAALGEAVSVTVEAQGEGLKYQWYFRNAGAEKFSKSGIKEATYSTEMNKTRAGREVYCVITDAQGNKITSDTAKLIRVAKEELAIITQPTDAEAAIGETVSTTVTAQGEGLKYRWYFRNAGATKFSTSSITTDTYSAVMDKTRAGREVYCVITDALGNKVTTDTVKLIRVAKEELAIITQPKDVIGAKGETVSVTVEAQGEGLKYQWYFRNAGAKSFSKSGIKEATYSTEMNKTRANREIYCVITDALGNQVTSDTVTLIYK